MAILDFRRSIDRHRVAQSVFGRIMRPLNPHETSSRFCLSALSPHKLILANGTHSVGLRVRPSLDDFKEVGEITELENTNIEFQSQLTFYYEQNCCENSLFGKYCPFQD